MSTIKIKNIQQTVIGGTTQPLKIGGILENGSDAKITIDTDGTTKLKGTAESLDKIVDTTLLATTNLITINSLNLVKGNTYRLEVYQNALNTGDVYLYVNGNTTDSNYKFQVFRVEGGTLAGAGANSPIIHYGRINTDSYFSYTFEIGYNNYLVGYSDSIEAHSNATFRKISMSSIIAVNPITSMTLSTVSNGFGIGTRIKLVRVA